MKFWPRVLNYCAFILCDYAYLPTLAPTSEGSFELSFTMRIVVCLFILHWLRLRFLTLSHLCACPKSDRSLFMAFYSLALYLILVCLYVLRMAFIITELIHMFAQGTVEARLRVWEKMVVLKTYWWPSFVFCSLVWLLSVW